MMGEASYLDGYWEDRCELGHDEPPYDSDERPDSEDHDAEDVFPFNVMDLSADGDALASAGWGMDEDYGGYSDE